MVVKQTTLQKYGRFGGLLLVAVLFLPILGVYLYQTMRLASNHMGVLMRPKNSAVYSTGYGGMMGLTDNKRRAAFEVAEISRPAGMMGGVAVSAPATIDRQLMKSATLDLRARSLDWTVGKIQEITKNVGGYVESANVSQPKVNVKTAWLTVRVPADRLDVTLDEVKKSASAVMNEHLNIGDVTDQDIDLSARLGAKLAEESALVSLLDKAVKVSDVIEVTDRLTLVRGEIERMQAEQRMLRGQVAMATVSISITEDPRVAVDTNSVRDGNVVKQSLADVSRWGIALGSALVAFLISGVPIIIIYGFFLWVAYRIGRAIAHRVVHRK